MHIKLETILMKIDSEEIKAWLEEERDYCQKLEKSMREKAAVQMGTFALAYQKTLKKIAELEQKQKENCKNHLLEVNTDGFFQCLKCSHIEKGYGRILQEQKHERL